MRLIIYFIAIAYALNGLFMLIEPRLWYDAIPGVPMLIPSDTVMVEKLTALPPASVQPWVACSASSARWTLQGVRSLGEPQMPTWGRSKSASSKPTARSMERAGARSCPSTTTDE